MPQSECSFCGYETKLESYPHESLANTEVELCDVCARTFLNASCDRLLAQSIGYIANLLLDEIRSLRRGKSNAN